MQEALDEAQQEKIDNANKLRQELVKLGVNPKSFELYVSPTMSEVVTLKFTYEGLEDHPDFEADRWLTPLSGRLDQQKRFRSLVGKLVSAARKSTGIKLRKRKIHAYDTTVYL